MRSEAAEAAGVDGGTDGGRWDGGREPGPGQDRPPVDRVNLALWLLGVLAAAASLWVLQAAASILIPLTSAFFVAIAVAPVGRWVRGQVPRRLSWLGLTASMLLILVILAAFFGSMALVAQRVAEDFPQYAEALGKLWAKANHWIRGAKADLTAAQGGQGAGQGAGQAAGQGGTVPVDPITGFAKTALSSAGQTISILVLTVFLSLLMQLEAPVWREKIVMTLGRERCRMAVEAVTAIAQQFRRYLVVSSVLGLITGALYVGWLSLFGVDLVLLWGFLAFLLNYVPVVGSVVAGALPVLLVLATQDAGTAMAVAAGLLVIEQVMGNFVAPHMQGKQLAISPLVVMIALLLWSWLWGAAGALLAAPMAVLIAITLNHADALRPFAIFMSDKSDRERFDAHTHPE
ncbi:AI-2 transport protein TqsA [Azospirillum oryzae]|uniref:AI-2 transport protein TqsA n=1 Tax=Azospirillum oryzae TaxID=286727 RepID=A0A1X7HTM0_9PROT|nr:AI-2E family transporter [Azospirillum oryzae]SMF91829.1 AI-2 transport protein TqsA [Azospirillum oryzae]